MNIYTKLTQAVRSGEAKILTVDLAKNLKGKRIQTIYYGYKDQHGIDDFAVGKVEHEIYANGERGQLCLFTEEGRNTYIRAHVINGGEFTCSDIDRPIYFLVTDDEN